MSTQVQDSNNLLESALLQETSFENTVVMAEDLPTGGGGVKWSDHFFEPQPGNTYHIKFLPNLGGSPITHRAVYKTLPDPTRKGKTFQYISSGNAKTCPVLDLFFELYELKKNGDVVAENKIKSFLKQTKQAVSLVQILSSPIKEEVGQIRMFIYTTFGPTTAIATAIKNKIEPTPEQVSAGFDKEDIFNAFGSSALILSCKESVIEGGQKVRDYGQPQWSPKKRYPICSYKDVNGVDHEVEMNDEIKAKIMAKDPEALMIFSEYQKQLKNPNLDIYKYFAYKTPGDERNDEDTEDYIKSIFEKITEIVPVIREKTIQEIKNYGKAVAAPGTATSKDSAKNVIADSLPEELRGMSINQNPEPTQNQSNDVNVDASVDDILNG